MKAAAEAEGGGSDNGGESGGGGGGGGGGGAQASGAFKKALDDSGVREEMEWEEAMKLVIHTEAYRGLPTLAERKGGLRRVEGGADSPREAAQRRERQLKVDFLTMLKECRGRRSRAVPRRRRALRRRPGGRRSAQTRARGALRGVALSLDRKEAAERRDERKAATRSARCSDATA